MRYQQRRVKTKSGKKKEIKKGKEASCTTTAKGTAKAKEHVQRRKRRRRRAEGARRVLQAEALGSRLAGTSHPTPFPPESRLSKITPAQTTNHLPPSPTLFVTSLTRNNAGGSQIRCLWRCDRANENGKENEYSG